MGSRKKAYRQGFETLMSFAPKEYFLNVDGYLMQYPERSDTHLGNLVLKLAREKGDPVVHGNLIMVAFPDCIDGKYMRFSVEQTCLILAALDLQNHGYVRQALKVLAENVAILHGSQQLSEQECLDILVRACPRTQKGTFLQWLEDVNYDSRDWIASHIKASHIQRLGKLSSDAEERGNLYDNRDFMGRLRQGIKQRFAVSAPAPK